MRSDRPACHDEGGARLVLPNGLEDASEGRVDQTPEQQRVFALTKPEKRRWGHCGNDAEGDAEPPGGVGAESAIMAFTAVCEFFQRSGQLRLIFRFPAVQHPVEQQTQC